MSDPNHPVRRTAAYLVFWERGRMQALGKTSADDADIRDMILAHRAEIRRALAATGGLALAPLDRALAAFCLLVFARENEDRARAFFQELARELSARDEAGEQDLARLHDAAYRLARRLRGHGRPAGERMTCALLFRAWTYWRVGLRTRQLRVDADERWWDLGPKVMTAKAYLEMRP